MFVVIASDKREYIRKFSLRFDPPMTILARCLNLARLHLDKTIGIHSIEKEFLWLKLVAFAS